MAPALSGAFSRPDGRLTTNSPGTRFTGAGGSVDCSTSTIARRDVIAQFFWTERPRREHRRGRARVRKRAAARPAKARMLVVLVLGEWRGSVPHRARRRL